MKYSASRKLNLANIDPILQYEMEELSVHDADSESEAVQKLDLWVKERILHYRQVIMDMKSIKATPSIPTTGGPVPAPVTFPATRPAAGTTPAVDTKTATTPAGASAVPPLEPASPAGEVTPPAVGGPPAEFE